MKKTLSLLLAAVMMLSMAACAPSDNATTTEDTSAYVPASALEVLENIWALYAEEDKFAVIGGNIENPVDGAPGNYNLDYVENLTYNLIIPADQITNIDDAATMIHMMNANNFTCGVVHLADAAKVGEFTSAVREAIKNNPWMCGFPDKLFIATLPGSYVMIAFGVNDAMDPFQENVYNAYATTTAVYDELLG